MSVIQRQGIPCGVGDRGGTLLPPQSVNWKYCGMILAQRLQGIAIPQAIRSNISFIHRVHANFLFKYSNRAGGGGGAGVDGEVTVLHSASSY